MKPEVLGMRCVGDPDFLDSPIVDIEEPVWIRKEAEGAFGPVKAKIRGVGLQARERSLSLR